MMRDFCNFTERDCIRLIIAQDLKENGIDLDAQKIQQQHQQSKHQSINKANVSTTINDTDADGNHVFGVPLKSLEFIEVKVNDQVLNIPIFLKHVLDHITEYLNVEGIFRRNGTATRLRELKRQVEAGQYDFSQFGIFDVTSLVKLFFRELPESLLTFALYSHFIQAIKLIDASKSKSAILNLCVQLPDINLHVLIYLMQFLKQISIHDADNKMNSFNLAVCFAPNIIYTRINKINELYINEERMIIQFLIENSSLIGKVSDSVYERSLMLTSLCCADGKDFDAEQESFTTARSTSLSSYCNNNKEKKKRRSSSLKELMTTIQNSISKFRRRSASEKNDKTTCSMMSTGSTCDEKPPIHTQATPYKLVTPMVHNLYTPRIKRNVEESIHSTTKKKLLEKLPQRNLLPNAPMTPFSTTKKNKHPFKLLDNKDAKFAPNTVQHKSSISSVSSSISCAPISTAAPKNYLSTQPITATPLNVVNLQKQLKYDDSPSVLFAAVSTSINPIYDTSGLKLKPHHFNTDRNHANDEIKTDVRRRLDMLPKGANNNSKLHSNHSLYSHQHHNHHKIPYSHHGHAYNHQHALRATRHALLSQNDTIYSSNMSNEKQHNETTKSLFYSGVNLSPASAHSQSTSEYSKTQQSLLTDSMRCSLKRGRPNTPKTGLNTEYRRRKSSVHTSPELILRAKENFEKQQQFLQNRLDDNLDTAVGLDDAAVEYDDGDVINNPIYSNLEDLNDARLDEAIIGLDDDDDDDLDDDDDDGDVEGEQSREDATSDDCDEISDLKVENIENESQIELEEMRRNNIEGNDEMELDNKNVEDTNGNNKEHVFSNFEDNFECDQTSIIEITKQKLTQIDNLDTSLLRRQSLFKLKEKMNGRVGKQINEIEKRKLSPYRFSNSPLKRASNLTKISPLYANRVKFSKSLLKTPILEEQFIIKSKSTTFNFNKKPNLPISSPLVNKIALCASSALNEINQNKKMQLKPKKRLNVKKSQSPLTKSTHGSPTNRSLIPTTHLSYASESFEF